MKKMVSPWKHSILLPTRNEHIVQKSVIVREGVGFIRTSNTTPLCMDLSVKSLSRAQPVAQDAQKPTASPRRQARDARFMCGRKSATRQRLIGPRILEAREVIGPAKSCECSLSRINPVATFCFLSSVQMTYKIEGIQGATGHGRSKKVLFPGGAECKDRGEVIRPGSLDLLKPGSSQALG